jgi:dimethylglycine dehydrogenase
VGKIRLAPMLNETGRLMGDLTIARLDEQRFWLTGSYYLQDWHQRWFRQHLPLAGVNVRNVTDGWMGFSISGPESRQILERLTHEDVSNEAFGFLTCRPMDVGTSRAVVGRISLTGELGYELTVPTEQHRTLLHELQAAGRASGLRLIGDRAVDSLRLEKGYGIWSTEFTQAYSPGMSGLDRFVAFDKGDFIGGEAARRERDTGAPELLVLLEVDAEDADASGDEGIWLDGRRVGLVTSGAYGHHVRKSLALAYVDREIADAMPDLTVHVVGDERSARILPEPPYDPKGSKLRDRG